MTDVKVCEGLKIINVNQKQLETLKQMDNPLDVGASAILEGLELFADELLDKYSYDAKVPYEKLFFALKQLITSGVDNGSVRDAILTGVIVETKEGVPVNRQPKKVEVKEVIKYVTKESTKRNKSAIAKYAKTHTLADIQEHFGFVSYNAAKTYMSYHNIPFVKRSKGRTGINLDVNQVRILAADMRLCELTRTFNCSKDQMMYFCRKNHIDYKRKKNEI